MYRRVYRWRQDRAAVHPSNLPRSFDRDLTKFRPCIDLHHGQVKQIVGGTLRDDAGGGSGEVVENHVSELSAAELATKYRRDNLRGGHVIQLGPGNYDAAMSAVRAYPGGLQIGGGIGPDNAASWIDAGASHVIVTSFLFGDDGQFDDDRLRAMVDAVGASRLVIDLSCRRVEGRAMVTSNRWQTITSLPLDRSTIERLMPHCDEFLIHAADVEGLCRGVDTALVETLGRIDGAVMTYAGGIASMKDIELIEAASGGRMDYTVGSALDLFGGAGVRYEDIQ